uniref:Uncharacterized protein n=1 Tax=Anguilla anguilla TaxID=7936 RepID=A0A0E9U1J6_ANGAN
MQSAVAVKFIISSTLLVARDPAQLFSSSVCIAPSA